MFKKLFASLAMLVALMTATVFSVHALELIPLGSSDPVTTHLWTYSTTQRTIDFTAPEGATHASVEALWGWTGNPGQDQQDETNSVTSQGGTISCPDFGDEELEGQNISCGTTTTFEIADNKVTVEVTLTGGEQSGNASHNSIVVVHWWGEQPEEAPATCVSATANMAILPNEGANVDIRAIGDNAYGMLLQANDGRTWELEGSDVTFSAIHAVSSTTFVAFAMGETGPVTSETCVVSFEEQPDQPQSCGGTVWINFDWSRGPRRDGTIWLYGQGLKDPMPSWTVNDTTRGWQVWPVRSFEMKEGWTTSAVEVVFEPVDGSAPEKLVILNWVVEFNVGQYGWVACDMFHSVEVGFESDIAEIAANPTSETHPAVLTVAAALGYPIGNVDTTVVNTEVDDSQVVETKQAEGTTHTVQAGDNLTRIANTYGFTIQDLLDANPQITNPNLIVVGWVLTIPGA